MSSRKAGRAWILAPLAAVLIAAVASAPASVHSAGGVRYVTKGFKVPGSKSRTLTATCPKHTHVLGGGEVNKEPYNSVVLRQTFPFDSGDKDKNPDDGWKVRIKSHGSDPVSVKAEAVCGNTNVRYTAVRFVAVAGTETGQVTAPCPMGKFAYSGGFSAPAKSKIFMNSMFPSDPASTGATAWGGYVDNPASQDEDSAAVIAVCGNSKPTITTSSTNAVTPHTQFQLRPACPLAKHVYGGGLATNAGFHTLSISSLGPATIHGVPSAGWSSNPDMTSGIPHDITGYAVCGPKLN